MEIAFKIVFFLAILLFCVAIVGIFLLIVKLMFLFMPSFDLMGIRFSPAVLQPVLQ